MFSMIVMMRSTREMAMMLFFDGSMVRMTVSELHETDGGDDDQCLCCPLKASL